MATIDNGAVRSALERDDPDALSRLLEDVDARAELNNGWFGLSQPPLTAARSTAVVDVLIELGADPALVGEWWGGRLWSAWGRSGGSCGPRRSGCQTDAARGRWSWSGGPSGRDAGA